MSSVQLKGCDSNFEVNIFQVLKYATNETFIDRIASYYVIKLPDIKVERSVIIVYSPMYGLRWAVTRHSNTCVQLSLYII